nr:copia protein [Tanacetum cinerariifolium]
MQEELNQLIANDIWELVPQPRYMIIIGTKWVFRNKLDENGIVSRNKARLVAQSYNQEKGIYYDETYALVARLESIRILLTYACALDFKLFQMDVKSAFLNGFINEKVYVAQPPRFIDFENPNYIYKLKKALYGLKQAPKAWYARLKSFLIKHEYKMKMVDNTLLTKKKRPNLIIIQIYVDDIMLGSTYQDMCDEFAKVMHDEFGMSMMEDSEPMKTSISSDTKLTKEKVGESVDSTKYRGMTEWITKQARMILPYGMLLTCLFIFIMSESPELVNESYVLYDHVMNLLTAQQERKTRKDCGTRRGRHFTSSSSAFDQPSSSHLNNDDDDDDDGNDEGTSRASTLSPTHLVNSLTSSINIPICASLIEFRIVSFVNLIISHPSHSSPSSSSLNPLTMDSTQASSSNPSKKIKLTIIPPRQLFVNISSDEDVTTTPSPITTSSFPYPPNVPSKTSSIKDTSSTFGTTSSLFESKPQSSPPTSNDTPSPQPSNPFFENVMNAPPRPSHPLPL